MQIAKATLVITPENIQTVRDLTPADALILHTLHYKEAKGAPLRDIVITGEAQTLVTPARPATPAEYNDEHKLVNPAKAAVPAVYRARTQAEERELLAKFYTGTLEGKPIFKALFPNPLAKLPETFEEVADAIGKPEITTEVEAKAKGKAKGKGKEENENEGAGNPE